MKSRRLFIVVLAATAATATGCSSAAPVSKAAALPALGPVPTITSPEQIALPIDDITPTKTQVAELIQASALATIQCVKSFGLDLSMAQTTDYSHVLPTYGDQEFGTLYGYFDPQNVATVGYNLATSLAAVPESQLTDSQSVVYFGEDGNQKPVTTFDGKSVPKGGCQQAGGDAVGGIVIPHRGADLPDGGPHLPQTDPRMNSVDARWSACMKADGYAYASPLDALADPRWVQQGAPVTSASEPTRLEIQVAEADMACKQSTNLVGQAVAIETAYENQYIDTHRAALSQYRQNLVARLRKAAAIVSAAGQI